MWAQTGVIIQVRFMTSGKKVRDEGFTLLGCREVSAKAEGHRVTKVSRWEVAASGLDPLPGSRVGAGL